MAIYYVKNGGNNALDGLSDGNAWETIGKVNSEMGTFAAGDSVLFKRGSDFTDEGRLYWTVAGSSGNRITIGAYDTGDDPVLDNTNAIGGNDCIVIVNVPYVTVENLNITGAPGVGVKAENTGSSNTIIQDCEISGCNWCIKLESEDNLVTNNYIHDPIRNADSGAIGVIAYRGSNEISYNTIEGCIGDYLAVADGCGVELISVSAVTPLADCKVHHNWIFDSFCAFELGGNPVGSKLEDNMIYTNVCVNNQGRFAVISTTGSVWEADLSGNKFFNNTVVQSIAATETPARIVNVAGTPATGEVRFANNVIYCADSSVSTIWDDEFDEDHNCYRYGGTTTLGLVADATSIEDDPEFTNLGTEDFTLQATSPCINVGADLGFAIDYNGNPIDAQPDMGAYEYQGQQASTDIVIATTRVACPTSTGNQTILTSKLLGQTPGALLVYISGATTDGTPAAHARLGMGAATATDARWAFAARSENAVGTTDTDRVGQSDACIIIIDSANNTLDGEADFVEFVTNGCTVNWSNAPGSVYFATFVFVAGSSLSAKAITFVMDDTQNNTVDVTTVGFEADVLIAAHGTYTWDGTITGPAHFATGIITNGDTVHQACFDVRSGSGDATSALSAQITESYGIGGVIASGAWQYTGEFGSFDASGFSCTTRLGNTFGAGWGSVGILALAFDGAIEFWSGIIDTPTSTGNQSQTGPEIRPQFVLCGPTQMPAIDTAYSDANAGSFGAISFDAYDAYCNSYQDEDGQGTSDTQSLSSDQVVDFPLDSGVAAHVATFVSFDTTGWTWNFSDTEGTAKKWWSLVLGEVSYIPQRVLRTMRNTLLRM